MEIRLSLIREHRSILRKIKEQKVHTVHVSSLLGDSGVVLRT